MVQPQIWTVEKPLVWSNTCSPHGFGTAFAYCIPNNRTRLSCALSFYPSAVSPARDIHFTQNLRKIHSAAPRKLEGRVTWQWPIKLQIAHTFTCWELPSLVGRCVCCNAQPFSASRHLPITLQKDNPSSHSAPNLNIPRNPFRWWMKPSFCQSLP